MPNWVSILGKWLPAKEFAVNDKMTLEDHRAGKSAVYEGPDRAAKAELDAAGVEHLGQDYHMEPDLIRAARELGFKTVDEYLQTMFGFDPKEAAKKQQELMGITNEHKLPEKKAPIKELGGGVDTTGKGKNTYGGFGDPLDIPGDGLKARAK